MQGAQLAFAVAAAVAAGVAAVAFAPAVAVAADDVPADAAAGHAAAAAASDATASVAVWLCQGKPYSSAADIWALGCIMIEAATFELPFRGLSFPELNRNICNAPVRCMRRVCLHSFVISSPPYFCRHCRRMHRQRRTNKGLGCETDMYTLKHAVVEEL